MARIEGYSLGLWLWLRTVAVAYGYSYGLWLCLRGMVWVCLWIRAYGYGLLLWLKDYGLGVRGYWLGAMA